MRPLRRCWNRFLGLFAGSRRETELSDEIAAHIEMQTEDNCKLGMPPAEARRAALVRFGGVEATKESYREQLGLPRLETLVKDIRFAVRTLRKSPEFSAAAILSLALGIGAATAIYSVVLLRSLPYPELSRLVTVSIDGAIPAPMKEILHRESRSIERSALFTSWWFNLPGQGGPERVPAARVSAEIFDLLGVRPQLGRTFTTEEDVEGRDNVVVIGDALWKRRFGGDPGVLGRAVRLNDKVYTIIGIMPPGFRFPEGPEHHAYVGPFPPAEMWRPMALVKWEQTCMGCFNFAMLAQLRRGATPAEAAAELDAIVRRHTPPHPGPTGLTILSLQDAVTQKVRAPVLILLAAVAMALLIACVNVANLLLARGLRRQEETAVRLSLGATRWRIVQQGLIEALTLAVCAGLLALPISWAAIRGLVALAPVGTPRIEDVSPDPRLFAFALCLALATTLIFGIVPAVLMASRAPGSAIKTGARSIGGRSRLRAALVIAECALSLVLLVGSGLLAKSFLAVSRVHLGFRPENVLTLQLSLPEARYDDSHRVSAIDNLLARCRELPGVTGAAAVSTLPLSGEAEGWGLVAEDHPARDRDITARARGITPGYFRTIGTKLIAGRDFTDSDKPSNPVAILSVAAARALWPGVAQPLGRRILDRPPVTVVGIVEDTHASGLDAAVRLYIYEPFSEFVSSDFALTIRTASDPLSLAKAVKAEVRKIDKDLPVTHVAAMTQVVADSIAPRRFEAVLMTLFAAFGTPG